MDDKSYKDEPSYPYTDGIKYQIEENAPHLLPFFFPSNFMSVIRYASTYSSFCSLNFFVFQKTLPVAS